MMKLDAADKKFLATWAVRIFGTGFAIIASASMIGLAAGVGLRIFDLVSP